MMRKKSAKSVVRRTGISPALWDVLLPWQNLYFTQAGVKYFNIIMFHTRHFSGESCNFFSIHPFGQQIISRKTDIKFHKIAVFCHFLQKNCVKYT